MSTYTYIGNATGATSGSRAMTTTGAVPAGALIIVTVQGNYAGLGALTVADNDTLTWTKDKEHIHSTSDPAAAIFSAPAPSGKGSGRTITATLASGTANLTIDARYVTNPAGGTVVDVSNGAENTGTAVATGTASPTTRNWIAVASISNHGAAFRTTTPQANWTEDTDSGTTAGGEAQSLIGTATSAIQGAGTLSASADWSAVFVVYKLTSPTSFPVNGTLDDFNTTASQNLTSRTGWDAVVLQTGNVTNKTDTVPTYCTSSSGTSTASNVWTGTTPNDSESWLTIASPYTNGTNSLYIFTRIQAKGSFTGYSLQCGTSPASFFRLVRWVAGVGTQIGTDQKILLSAGDSIGISVVGTTISSFWKPSGGSWQAQDVVTDATITGAGQFAGFLNVAASRVDAIGGGSLDPVVSTSHFLSTLGVGT